MTRTAPAFPPDVAAALQRPAGSLSVRCTTPAWLTGAPPHDLVLMETPYARVLAALVLDTKLTLRFVRTGDPSEGARVARTDAGALVARGVRHWDVALRWDPKAIDLAVRAGGERRR